MWPRLNEIPLNEKGEYFLTDLIARAVSEGHEVGTVQLTDSQEVEGINTREQLAEAEAVLRWRIRRRLMQAGVTLIDPASTFVDQDVEIGQDTIIYPNCLIEGKTVIGNDCVIGPNTQIINSQIGTNCQVRASVIEHSTLANNITMGPFSRIRQGASLADGIEMGNFAEIKKSQIGEGTKMHHFSYLGDATVGKRVNIGAGTITCNFDSETGKKSPTVLENDVAVGSDTMLVAPVTIGEGSSTGAGSVVTEDIPSESVAVGVPAKVIRASRRKKNG
jgi:bifunctional UDP-N-acetylglucosamine pyrophosphorylase/glucosamine-1-phosphate N-acetyltransferase